MGAAPNISPRNDRIWRPRLLPLLYRDHNAIECVFGCIKDLRRIAARCDKLTRNVLAAVCLLATKYAAGYRFGA